MHTMDPPPLRVICVSFGYFSTEERSCEPVIAIYPVYIEARHLQHALYHPLYHPVKGGKLVFDMAYRILGRLLSCGFSDFCWVIFEDAMVFVRAKGIYEISEIELAIIFKIGGHTYDRHPLPGVGEIVDGELSDHCIHRRHLVRVS